MKVPALIVKIIEELRFASILERVSFVANLFTIIGISIAALFVKPAIEWALKRELNVANFFLGAGVLLFWTLVFFAILIGYTYLRQFFAKVRFGLPLYYGLIVVYFLFGFSLMSSLGMEMVDFMISR